MSLWKRLKNVWELSGLVIEKTKPIDDLYENKNVTSRQIYLFEISNPLFTNVTSSSTTNGKAISVTKSSEKIFRKAVFIKKQGNPVDEIVNEN